MGVGGLAATLIAMEGQRVDLTGSEWHLKAQMGTGGQVAALIAKESQGVIGSKGPMIQEMLKKYYRCSIKINMMKKLHENRHFAEIGCFE